MESKEYEEVKVYVGYDMPMSDDSYAKDKATIGFSYTRSSGTLDRKRVEDELYEVVDNLAVKLGEYMVTKGKEVIDAEVNRRVAEIEIEYEEKLNLARQKIKALGEKK